MWSCWSLSSWIWGGVLGDISNTCGSGRIQLKPWGEEGWHSSFGVAERGPEHRQGWVLKPKSVGSNGGRHVTQVIQTILNLIHGFGEIMMMTTWKLDDFLRLHLRAFPKRDTIVGEFWLCSTVKGMTLQGSLWTHWSLFLHRPGVTRVIMEWLCPFFCVSQATWGHHPHSQAGEAREITCDHQRGDGRFVEKSKKEWDERISPPNFSPLDMPILCSPIGHMYC